MKRIIVMVTPEIVEEHDIDIDIFDDPYLEAATRTIEQHKNEKYKLKALIRCMEFNGSLYKMYNSYWVMVNAGLYARAEEMRKHCLHKTGIDPAWEPLHT